MILVLKSPYLRFRGADYEHKVGSNFIHLAQGLPICLPNLEHIADKHPLLGSKERKLTSKNTTA